MNLKNLLKSGLLLGLALSIFSNSAFSQTADSAPIQPPATLLQSFDQTQAQLSLSLNLLESQGDSDDEIDLWHQKNASLLSAYSQQGQLIAAYAYFQPVAPLTVVEIPDGASPDLEDFLVTQASLSNRLAQIHNQIIQTTTLTPTIQNADTLSASEDTQFRQQNAAALQAQAQRILSVSDQIAHTPQALPLLPPVTASTSPKMAAYLQLSYQLQLDEILLHNQYCAGDLAQLESLTAQWQQQNAARFQQLRLLAQNLSTVTPD